MCTIEIERFFCFCECAFFWQSICAISVCMAVHRCTMFVFFLFLLVCDMLLGAVCNGYNSQSNMHLSEVSFAGVRVCACGCVLLFVAEEKDCCVMFFIICFVRQFFMLSSTCAFPP